MARSGAGDFHFPFFVAAPYGRYARRGWGATVSDRMGWVVMECISPILFAVCFAIGGNEKNMVSLIFFCLWEAHYLHRAFIYPFYSRTTTKRMPALVMSLGLIFRVLTPFKWELSVLVFRGLW